MLKKTKTINFGIGENYLKSWGVQEALREIYQNFLDHGTFLQRSREVKDNQTEVKISNNFKPADLSFLKLGESEKGGNHLAIGSHGEGLKMAFLVMLRLGYPFKIRTPEYNITATWEEQDLIGKTLALEVEPHSKDYVDFEITFIVPTEDFTLFNKRLIKPQDILFTAPTHGSIVDKPQGELYVGKLYVCTVPNFKKAYNLNANVLQLDRDRRVPNSFDTSWHTSKINKQKRS